MPFGRRGAITKTLKFLEIIESKNGKALKFDLWKEAGNEAAFRRWITNFLIKEKIVEKVEEGKKPFFKKTERGEIFHRILKYDQHLVVAFLRISGKRLKSES